MIDCPKIREDLKLSQEEYAALYPIAMGIYFGYYSWEHACNKVEKSTCEVDVNLLSDEEFDRHIIEHWEWSINEINANPAHNGSCIKQPCMCMLCYIGEYFNDARFVRSRTL